MPFPEFAIQASQNLHLLVALGGGAAGGRFEVRDGNRASLKRRRCVAGAEVAAGQLYGRRGASDVDVGGQILIAGSERVGHPASEGRIIESASAMAGLRFDHRREVIAFLAPEGPHDRYVVNYTANVGKPVRDRCARLAIVLESPQTGDNGALHLGNVVSEADSIDQFTSVLVAFGVKSVDMTDAAAHEEEDDRVGFLAARQIRIELAVLRPKRAHRSAQKSADGLLEHVAA